MIIQAEIYNHRHIIGFITRRQALVFVVHTSLINLSEIFLSSQLRFCTSLLGFFVSHLIKLLLKSDWTNQISAEVIDDKLLLTCTTILLLSARRRKGVSVNSFIVLSFTRLNNKKIAKLFQKILRPPPNFFLNQLLYLVTLVPAAQLLFIESNLKVVDCPRISTNLGCTWWLERSRCC